ncbi:hypothetical protein HID58_060524 [Brassica napus]|uniref:K-box domain-containing protein n=1 Tax=Brassica napus TaxID=3708 RepID=A0ABQ7ZW67_BRANA|nr:hypothetical protein HID58_060524 [Brassica napus]
MEKTIERYSRCNNNILDNNRPEESTQRWSQEVTKLRSKYESLLRTHRYLLGEDLGEMSVKELETLERQLEGALSATRQRKTQVTMEQMEDLRRKASLLERQLGDINKKMKLEVEGHEFKGFQDLLLNSDARAGSTDFSLFSSHHNSGLRRRTVLEKRNGLSKLEKMGRLYMRRDELALIILYLNKAEARDKICRAIQFGSKFLSGGHPGTAQTVDKNTSLARKVFRLFKFLNDFHLLISPVPKGTPLPLVLLGKSKNALLCTYYFLDQFVWLGRSGIYKVTLSQQSNPYWSIEVTKDSCSFASQNKVLTELIRSFAIFCWLGSSLCNIAIQIGELIMHSSTMKKMEKELKDDEEQDKETDRAKLQKTKDRILALIKSSMDTVVAIGLLHLAPFIVTPRVTGAFGFVTSLISCYQLLPGRPKLKTP